MLKILSHTSTRIAFTSIRKMSNSGEGKPLKAVLETLENFAPIKLAEKWDNVGLLIEPYKTRPIKHILLTNDLTQNVMEEAIARQTDMIISYHPPIFKPLTRLTQSNWKERIVSACVHHSIALYSPHTAWDSVKGGVNDWLASALPFDEIRPLQENEILAGAGVGRILKTTSINVGNAIERLQQHIGLNVHVGLASDHDLNTNVRTVALCAGSGASVLRNVKADLIISGEMSHHEVLDFNHNSTTVLLCNHSNSERGFLKQFKPELERLLNAACVVEVSNLDKDPLETYVKAVK